MMKRSSRSVSRNHHSCRAAWKILGFGLLAAAGCGRTYRAESPRPLQTPSLNARVDGLQTSLGAVEVRMQVAGRAGVQLYDARLVRSSDRECSGGKTFARIESGGRDIEEGPLDLAGSRELYLAYQDGPLFETLRAGAAVDLQIKEAGHNGCVRVPLVNTSGAPSWRVVPSARFAMGSRLRVFPLKLHDPGKIAPDGAAVLRLAVTSPSLGVWVDSAGAFRDGPGERTSSDLVLAGGAELTLFRAGDFAALLDGGYQVVWYLERPSKAEQGKFRYRFHGPELAPKLSYTFWTVPYLPTLGGGAHLDVELELPVALWFGSGDAPPTTLVPGVGLGVLGVF
jgi:hypothetical protein